MTDAWAGTVGPGWREVPVDPPAPDSEPRSRSAPRMCEPSPDSCHWWDISAVCSQSIEQMTCRWCSAVAYD